MTVKGALLTIYVLGFLALGTVLALGQRRPDRVTDSCTLERIIDGDTVVCQGDRRIRLLGYDAPELPSYQGRMAKAALENLLPLGETLHLWRLPQEDSVDIYGRELWRVYRSINATMADRVARIRVYVREPGEGGR